MAGITYHLMLNDARRNRAVFVTFNAPSTEQAPEPVRQAPGEPRSLLAFLRRDRFEEALKSGLICASPLQRELPPWLGGLTRAELIAHDREARKQCRAHADRIDSQLVHLWPAIERVQQILEADNPAAVLNKLARACQPRQNETRFRRSFFAYVAFGRERLALHYSIDQIGKWDRRSHDKKFGRPSKLGAWHGHSSCDEDMQKKCREGYEKFAAPSVSMRSIHRQTLMKLFGCHVATGPDGRMTFVHPEGKPFPTVAQFQYRVRQAYDLKTRQTLKYGFERVKSRLAPPRGAFTDAVACAMEALQADGYFVADVCQGYLEGSHLPRLCAVRIICVATGVIVGIGFSLKGERAEAYRMAKFCMAVDKVWFCSLFGMKIAEADWPTVGVPLHDMTDRGPGATVGGDTDEESLLPIIKELAPAYSGQSKANVETRHPKSVKLEGAPSVIVTRQTLPQLAVREIWRVIESNNSTDISSRLGPRAVEAGVLSTPVGFWNYLNKLGRTMAYRIPREQAIRAYLRKVDLTLDDGAVFFMGFRYYSKALYDSEILTLKRRPVQGFAFPLCVRHLFLDTADDIFTVDATFGIQTDEGEMFVSIAELEQLAQLRDKEKAALAIHREATKADVAERFEAQTGTPYQPALPRLGRAKRGSSASLQEARDIGPILSASGGKR
jgi:hypothetical protein